MNGIECVSITAGIITIIHFTKDSFLSYFMCNDDDSSNEKLCCI